MAIIAVVSKLWIFKLENNQRGREGGEREGETEGRKR